MSHRTLRHLSPEIDAEMDSILSRIAKLHALAQRGGTPKEAEVAAAKVQSLLLRHNLQLTDVEGWDRHAEGVVMVQMPAQDSIWRAKLLGVVAMAHLCRAVRTVDAMGANGRYTIIGVAHNVRVVQSVYAWLRDLIPAACAKAERANMTESLMTGVEAWRHSFRLGMIDGIKDAYDAARAALNAETSLALLEEDVTDVVEAYFPDATPHRFGGEADLAAYALGRDVGRAVNTQTQVGGSDAAAIESDATPAGADQS